MFPGKVTLIGENYSAMPFLIVYFFYFAFEIRIIGEIGLKYVEFLPEIVPVLITVLNDATPAVARQAINCGINLFRRTLERIAVQVNLSIDL